MMFILLLCLNLMCIVLYLLNVTRSLKIRLKKKNKVKDRFKKKKKPLAETARFQNLRNVFLNSCLFRGKWDLLRFSRDKESIHILSQLEFRPKMEQRLRILVCLESAWGRIAHAMLRRPRQAPPSKVR